MSVDQVIIGELKILGVHAGVQFVLFLLLTSMTMLIGFPGTSFIAFMVFIIGTSTIREDLRIISTEGSSAVNSVIRAITEFIVIIISSALIVAVCDLSKSGDNLELKCNFGGFGFLFLMFANILGMAFMRMAINLILLSGQFVSWLLEMARD